MKKYNLEYTANGKTIVLKDVTLQEAQEFINRLKKENESSLQLRQIKKDEEER